MHEVAVSCTESPGARTTLVCTERLRGVGTLQSTEQPRVVGTPLFRGAATVCAEFPGARTELGVRGAALGARTSTGVPGPPQCTERPRSARIFPVHGAALDCRDRLWGAGTPSTRSGSEVHGASQCMDGLRDARILQHTEWLWGAWTPQRTKRPRGVQSPPVHRRTVGCMERFWGAGTPQSTEQPRTLPEHGWTLQFMEQLRVQGQALECWDPPMHRGAMGYTDSLVHGRTLGCTEQLWVAGTPQNTEQPRGARSLPVYRQTQGCVRQLQVQGQAVGCRDSPVYGTATGCMELPGHEWASGGADSRSA